jgi:hypothetical protein
MSGLSQITVALSLSKGASQLKAAWRGVLRQAQHCGILKDEVL